MCGRYGLYDAEDLEERFMLDVPPLPIKSNYNVAPGQIMPVILQSDKGRTSELMKWGLVPFWAKDEKIGYKMINARSETIFEKPAWRKSIKSRRILVPARGFYEWKKTDSKKQPYFIHPHDQELFSFAGLYDEWKSPENNQLLRTYTIITTTPNSEMRQIHDRMPVIMDPDNEDVWLDSTLDDKEVIREMLRPYPDGKLDMFPVSTDVNIVKNNDERLVYPINSK